MSLYDRKSNCSFKKNDLVKRFSDCGLNLNEAKTRIVYCKQSGRNTPFEITSFNYLGFTFRARCARNSKTGELFTTFSPAISNKAK